MNLNGKNVVYVGGCGGIGYETCKLLVQKNVASLVILDKVANPEGISALQLLNPNVAVHFLTYDVTQSAAGISQVFTEILRKVQRIDVLVNGAGILNDQQVELTLQVNLAGLINTTTEVFKQMDKRHGGSGGVILNVASMSGLNPISVMPVYSATKAGVIAFSRALAQVQSATGVNIFAVCPGGTATAMAHRAPSYLDLDYKLVPKSYPRGLQTTAACAANIVSAIEQNRNGAIWLLVDGKMELLEAAAI